MTSPPIPLLQRETGRNILGGSLNFFNFRMGIVYQELHAGDVLFRFSLFVVAFPFS